MTAVRALVLFAGVVGAAGVAGTLLAQLAAEVLL